MVLPPYAFCYLQLQPGENLCASIRHLNSTMAEKEATIYIVDMGQSMGGRHNGRKESDLDWAMTYVWEKITSTVSTASPGPQMQGNDICR